MQKVNLGHLRRASISCLFISSSHRLVNKSPTFLKFIMISCSKYLIESGRTFTNPSANTFRVFDIRTPAILENSLAFVGVESYPIGFVPTSPLFGLSSPYPHPFLSYRVQLDHQQRGYLVSLLVFARLAVLSINAYLLSFSYERGMNFRSSESANQRKAK